MCQPPQGSRKMVRLTKQSDVPLQMRRESNSTMDVYFMHGVTLGDNSGLPDVDLQLDALIVLSYASLEIDDKEGCSRRQLLSEVFTTRGVFMCESQDVTRRKTLTSLYR